MNPKKKNQEMHKLYCICQLLLDSIDTLKPTSQKMIKFKEDLTGLCEQMNEDVNDTYTIQKTTYFQQITYKIDTILRHECKSDM